MAFRTTIPLNWGSKTQDDFSITEQYSNASDAGNFQVHWHDCFEILLILEGSRQTRAGDLEFALSRGDILVIPPHLSHGFDNGIFRCISFGYAESVIYTPDSPLSALQFLLPFRDAAPFLITRSLPEYARLYDLICSGLSFFTSSSPVRLLEIHACILQVHALVWQCYLNAGCDTAKNQHYLQEVQSYIESHFSENISPYDIAEALHISHSHLCRIIKKALHITPAALINQYRLHLAERLLTTQPSLSVTEIAFRCGFEDTSYFIRLFRKEKGITPGKLRTSLK